MTVAAVCLAVAVLVAPGPIARHRLRSATGTEPAAARRVGSPLVIGASAAVVVALVVGVAVALATSIVVATAVWRMRTRRRARAADADQRMLLGALETVIAELRVGNHPAEACAVAAQESGGPAAEAFRVAAARARLGGSAADGLRGATSGPLGAQLERVAAAWAVSDRHGLALAELLSATRTDLLGRIRLRARTEAGLAGARATATVLAGLPALGVALGQAMGAAPIAVLLGGGLGGALLVFGTGLACAGLLWTDRISARVAS
ncbi:type II secretion system F family protein [Rhodococcus sp. NPDC003383]